MDIASLVKITSRAWSLPILASLHDGTPGRQAPLLAATGAGRTAFVQSLTHLMEIGLVERNPGYGHPLRPEFRLTERGVEVAHLASRVLHETQNNGQLLVRRAWTLPVLVSLQEPRQFSALRRDLEPITDRALSQSLKSLEDHEWVSREVVVTTRPPKSLYSSINTGAELTRLLRKAA